MAEQHRPEKTIEMRLAEIEEKLSQLHITEEEMRTFQKVSNALGMGAGAGQAGATQFQTGASQLIPISRTIGYCRICIIRWNCTCICPCGPCYECSCGPCNCAGGGGAFGGGFSGFGT